MSEPANTEVMLATIDRLEETIARYRREVTEPHVRMWVETLLTDGDRASIGLRTAPFRSIRIVCSQCAQYVGVLGGPRLPCRCTEGMADG